MDSLTTYFHSCEWNCLAMVSLLGWDQIPRNCELEELPHLCPAMQSNKGVLLGIQPKGRSWPAALTQGKTLWTYRQGAHLGRPKGVLTQR